MELGERVATGLRQILRANLPGALWRVGQEYLDEQPIITLPPPTPDQYYLASNIDALRLPAVFIIVQEAESVPNLQQGEHTVLPVDVTVVVESVDGATALKKKSMRYSLAMFRVLHDYGTQLGTTGNYPFLVRAQRAIYGGPVQRDTRTLEMEALVKLRVTQYEAWA
jgi:hypothetical protein